MSKELGTYEFPALVGRRVSLRPPLPSDYEWLYAAALQPKTGIRWRLRGATPSFDQFVDFLWRGTDVQFVVCARQDGTRLGLVQMIRHSPKDGHAALSVFIASEYEGAGWPLESLWLFVNYLFTTHHLRKLYIESLDFSAELFSSLLGNVLAEEGLFREHEFYDGEYLDLRVMALYRETWETNRDRIRRALGWTAQQ